MTNRQTVASRLACSLLLAMAVGTQATAADTLETVEKDIAAKFEAVKSITADFVFLQRVKTEQFSAEATRKGNYAYMKGVDGKRRFRMEMKNTSKQTMQGNEMEVKSEVVIIDDGTHVVSLTTQENTQPSATKTLSDPKAISGGGGAAIEQLKRAYNVTLLPPTKIDGMDCYALEGKPKNPTPGLPVSNKSYFSKDGGVLVKMEGVNAAGDVIQSMVYKNVKMNTSLDPGKFVIDLPENIQMIDMTQPSVTQPKPQPAAPAKKTEPAKKTAPAPKATPAKKAPSAKPTPKPAPKPAP